MWQIAICYLSISPLADAIFDENIVWYKLWFFYTTIKKKKEKKRRTCNFYKIRQTFTSQFNLWG